MTFSVKLSSVTLEVMLVESIAPLGYVNWSLGGVTPFARDWPVYLYPVTFVFPEMLAALDKCKSRLLTPDEPANHFVHRCQGDATKLSSQSFLDGFHFQILASNLGPIVGWKAWETADTAENWTAVVCRHADLVEAAAQFSRFYESLL